jgi:hypothetical protein
MAWLVVCPPYVIVTDVFNAVNAAFVAGEKLNSLVCPEYVYVSLVLLLYVRVITNPVGSKLSPTRYFVFVGAVETDMLLSVSVVNVDPPTQALFAFGPLARAQ